MSPAHTIRSSGIRLAPDIPICQTDLPLDWYQEEVKPYAEAGATWWNETQWDLVNTMWSDETQQKILARGTLLV